MSEDQNGPGNPILELNIGDRNYELYLRQCEECGNAHYEIWRWSGASFARWLMRFNFQPDDFQTFVEILDQQLLMTANELLTDFRHEMDKVNSTYGIEADWSYSFRLIEYGRQRASLLRRLNYFDALISAGTSSGPDEIAIRAAFELGHAAAEHRIMVNYEEYLFDGIAMSEWREAGLPKARQERLRQGERTRAEVLKAAKLLYAKNPVLVRNDTETARQILKLKLPGLQKGNGHQVSLDAITRHLRDARRHLKIQKN